MIWTCKRLRFRTPWPTADAAISRPSTLSFPRKRESMSMPVWMPVFTGMTGGAELYSYEIASLRSQ